MIDLFAKKALLLNDNIFSYKVKIKYQLNVPALYNK